MCAIHLDIVQSDLDGDGLPHGPQSNLQAGFPVFMCHNVSTWELSLPLSDKDSADSFTTPVLITSCYIKSPRGFSSPLNSSLQPSGDLFRNESRKGSPVNWSCRLKEWTGSHTIFTHPVSQALVLQSSYGLSHSILSSFFLSFFFNSAPFPPLFITLSFNHLLSEGAGRWLDGGMDAWMIFLYNKQT